MPQPSDDDAAASLQSWLGRRGDGPFSPSSAGRDPSLPPPKVDPTYAWSLALMPLAALIATVVAPAAIAGSVWVGVIAVSVVLAVLDEKRLTAAGVNVSAGLALLIIPVYLIQRTRALHSTPAVPVVWFATFVLSVLVALNAPQAYSINGTDMASYIKRDLHQQYGPGRLSVTCPDMKGHAGDQVGTCTANDGKHTIKLLVVVTSTGRFNYSVG